jgi:hypothetical protein
MTREQEERERMAHKRYLALLDKELARLGMNEDEYREWSAEREDILRDQADDRRDHHNCY